METRGILSSPAIVALIAAGLAVVAYLAMRARLERRDLVLLIGARVGALVLLWVALLEPTRVFTREVAIPAQVAVLVDRSQSMTIQDEPGAAGTASVSRWAAAVAAADRLSTRLQDRFEVRQYVFDAAVEGRSEGAWGEPGGHATDVGAAIDRATRDARGAPLAGVVVFTDGAQNVGGDGTAKSYDAPVFPVGVGLSVSSADIAVSSVRVPDVLLAGETAHVKATVIVRGYAGRQFTATLARGESLVSAVQVTAVGAEHIEELDFEIRPNEPGSYRYAAEISPVADELTAANNRIGRTVSVLPSRTRVLLAWGAPDAEFAALRRSLRRVPSVDLTVAMTAMPDVRRDVRSPVAQAGVYPVDAPSSQLPDDSAELDSYDVVVIGDLSVAMLAPKQIAWLTEFVEARGGGIAWCAGGRWLGRRLGVGGLERLLPVNVPASGARLAVAEFAPSLTRQGRSHAVTQLAQTPSGNEALWRQMPLWSRQYVSLIPKVGSTTLVAGAGGQSPAVIYHRVGAGKSMLFATDALWKWALADAAGPAAGATSYDRLWAQAVRWLATPPDTRQVRIELSQTDVDTGASVPVTVRVFGAGYVPEPDAVVDVTVEGPDGRAASTPVAPVAGDPGAFRAVLRPTREGVWRLTASASARGVSLGQDTATLSVQTPRLEFQRPGRNDELLAGLADASGGQYVTAAQVDTIPPLLRDSDVTREVRERKALWNTPALLIAVAALLGSEWWLRKRRGLV
jgi:hypothetical protein